MNLKKIFFCLVILNSSHIFAGTILNVLNNQEQITITNDFAGRPLELNDKICIFDLNETELACGIAADIKPQEILLKVEQKKGELTVGKKIKERRYVKVPIFTKERTIINNKTTEKIVRKTITSRKSELNNKTLDLSLGAEVGFPLYYYPNLHIQLALSKYVSIGLQPLWIPDYTNNTNIKVGAYGGFATLNWYFHKYAFKGFYAQLAGGAYKINLEQSGTSVISEEHTQWAAKGTINWRGTAIPSIGLDFGVTAGAQYVNDYNSAFLIEFKKLLPVFGGFVAISLF